MAKPTKTESKAASKPGTKEAAVEEAPKKAKEKKEKKSQKERKISVKKHAKSQVWKKYEVKGDTVVRKNKACPRCGAGTFMAEYKERKYCGKCGYAEMGMVEKK